MKKIELKGNNSYLIKRTTEILNDLGKNKNYIVTISEPRNLTMNNTLYGWLKILSDDSGYTTEELKYYFMIKMGYYEEIKSIENTSMTYQKPKSTADLSKEEFSALLSYIDKHAIEQNIKLPTNEKDLWKSGIDDLLI